MSAVGAGEQWLSLLIESEVDCWTCRVCVCVCVCVCVPAVVLAAAAIAAAVWHRRRQAARDAALLQQQEEEQAKLNAQLEEGSGGAFGPGRPGSKGPGSRGPQPLPYGRGVPVGLLGRSLNT
jgi:hypothetical protein